MTHPDGDILRAMLERLAQYAPAPEVERTKIEFRERYGGTTIYVKMPPSAYRVQTSHAPGVALDPDGRRKLKK